MRSRRTGIHLPRDRRRQVAVISISQTRLRAFWDWFASVAAELGANLEDAKILAELDARVRSLGDLVWEVGPGIVESNALTISPSGRPEWLAVTTAIVNAAPDCDGWEFHPAKPPKDFDLRFTFEDRHGRPVDVDASGWQYVLLELPGGAFDIVVRTPSLTADEDANQNWRPRYPSNALWANAG